MASNCTPTLDDNFAETTEHPRMTVLCVIWNQSSIVSSISVPSTMSVSKKAIESVDTTQPSTKYGDSFRYATHFQCLRKRAKVAVATPSNYDDVIAVPENRL